MRSDDMLLTPNQKVINIYISIANYVCIFIFSTYLLTYIISNIFVKIANLANTTAILSIAENTVTTYDGNLSKINALIYIAFTLSFIFSIFISAKLTYILKFNNVRFIWLKKIITVFFTLVFTAIFALLLGSVFKPVELQPLYKPLSIFFINLFKNFIPSLFMFNELIGIK